MSIVPACCDVYGVIILFRAHAATLTAWAVLLHSAVCGCAVDSEVHTALLLCHFRKACEITVICTACCWPTITMSVSLSSSFLHLIAHQGGWWCRLLAWELQRQLR